MLKHLIYFIVILYLRIQQVCCPFQGKPKPETSQSSKRPIVLFKRAVRPSTSSARHTTQTARPSTSTTRTTRLAKIPKRASLRDQGTRGSLRRSRDSDDANSDSQGSVRKKPVLDNGSMSIGQRVREKNKARREAASFCDLEEQPNYPRQTGIDYEPKMRLRSTTQTPQIGHTQPISQEQKRGQALAILRLIQQQTSHFDPLVPRQKLLRQQQSSGALQRAIKKKRREKSHKQFDDQSRRSSTSSNGSSSSVDQSVGQAAARKDSISSSGSGSSLDSKWSIKSTSSLTSLKKLFKRNKKPQPAGTEAQQKLMRQTQLYLKPKPTVQQLIQMGFGPHAKKQWVCYMDYLMKPQYHPSTYMSSNRFNPLQGTSRMSITYNQFIARQKKVYKHYKENKIAIQKQPERQWEKNIPNTSGIGQDDPLKSSQQERSEDPFDNPDENKSGTK